MEIAILHYFKLYANANLKITYKQKRTPQEIFDICHNF